MHGYKIAETRPGQRAAGTYLAPGIGNKTKLKLFKSIINKHHIMMVKKQGEGTKISPLAPFWLATALVNLHLFFLNIVRKNKS